MHIVTEEVDAGPVVVQKKVPVVYANDAAGRAADTPESLKAKVQPLEGVAFIEAVDLWRAML